MNWINGPLLRESARRYGYRVDFAPFAYRAKSNVVTLTTSLME